MNAHSDLDNAPIFLELNNIDKHFGHFQAVDDVSLTIREGEFVSILGPSGCGKTTLLRIIAGLAEQSRGQVIMEHKDISNLAVAKRHCGIVFQSYALFPNLTARKNVVYGIKKSAKLSKQAIQAKVDEVLKLVGLHDMSHKYPVQMSGGQQQRVALARALATDPKLLLLDEPLSALDAKVRHKLRVEICRIQKTLGITTVMVTHDQEEALTMADRIVIMNDGQVRQFASPKAIYKTPADRFVAGFIGSMNFLKSCRLLSDNQIGINDLKLNIRPISETALANCDRNNLTIGIRPEEIKPLDLDKQHDPNDPNIIETKIVKNEFRGSFHRLYLRPNRPDFDTSNYLLTFDIQLKNIQRLNIQDDQPFKIYLPADQILLFNGQTDQLLT